MKEGWEYKRIDEITIVITDGDWIESKHQSDDGFRLIQTGNIGRGIFKAKDDKPHFISETTFKDLSCTEIFEGDCLISRLPDPVGRSCLIPNTGNRMITAVDCTILRFKKEIIPSFFVYYTQSIRYSKEIEGNVTGATRKRISRKNLEKIQVPIPPLSEQQHIVEELDLLSSIIEKKKAQLNELDNLAQSLFYEMFGDPITNEKGWIIRKLADISKEKLSYGSGASAIPYDGKMRYIRITDINDSGELNENIVSPNSFDEKYLLNDGDILFARSGATVGKTYYHKERYGKCIYAGYLIRLIPNADIVLPSYVFGYTKTQYYIEFVKRAQNAVAQPNINAKQYGNLDICIPPLSLQNQYEDKVKNIEHQKELIKQSIKEVEMLFNSRMDYYFN